jgi:hypothetical protein
MGKERYQGDPKATGVKDGRCVETVHGESFRSSLNDIQVELLSRHTDTE